MKLFVCNLPFNFTEKELEELFAACGGVKSAKLITDRATGRFRGFGFVEMNSREEGQKAIDELNGKVVGARPIVVNEARPRSEGGGAKICGGGGDRPRGGGGVYARYRHDQGTVAVGLADLLFPRSLA